MYQDIQLRVEERLGSWRGTVYDGRLFPIATVAEDGSPSLMDGVAARVEPPWTTEYFLDKDSAVEWAMNEATRKAGPPPDEPFAQWFDQSDMTDDEWQRKLDELNYVEQERA